MNIDNFIEVYNAAARAAEANDVPTDDALGHYLDGMTAAARALGIKLVRTTVWEVSPESVQPQKPAYREPEGMYWGDIGFETSLSVIFKDCVTATNEDWVYKFDVIWPTCSSGKVVVCWPDPYLFAKFKCELKLGAEYVIRGEVVRHEVADGIKQTVIKPSRLVFIR